LYLIEKVLVMTDSIVKVSDSLEGLQDLLSAEVRVIAIVDRKVGELYHQVLPVQERIFIDAYESSKTLSTVSYITGRLLEMEADRNILLLGIGGGITTDITGFTASVYKRGVRFAFIPTTLLAQVDASIGGKNGVNHTGLKNIIGSFNMPSFIWSSTSFLGTLPRKELLNGVSELLKTLIIGDADLYRELVISLETDSDSIGWSRYIECAVQIKSCIVSQDFRDTGERMKLNLGHTFGHAIEKCAADLGEDIPHGEAVSAGLIIAARLSEKMGYAPSGTTDGIMEDFKGVGLRTEVPYTMELLTDAVRNDKKRDGDCINFAFIRGIGDVSVHKIKLEDISL